MKRRTVAARGVHTNRGSFAAGEVVLTAGNWTAPLLERMTGQRLPLIFVRHQYSIRGGVDEIHPRLPSVTVVEDAVYARPVGRDVMFGAYEPHSLEFDCNGIPRTTDDVELDHQANDSALGRVADLFPIARFSFFREVRGGVVTMTPDGSYLIDRACGVDDLFFVLGATSWAYRSRRH